MLERRQPYAHICQVVEYLFVQSADIVALCSSLFPLSDAYPPLRFFESTSL